VSEYVKESVGRRWTPMDTDKKCLFYFKFCDDLDLEQGHLEITFFE